MKKIIVKTIAFSLTMLLAFFATIYFALSIFAPSTLANLYFRIDAKELTLKYSEKAYEKSGEISDLSILVERSIVYDCERLVIEHATTLINHADYEEYADNQGGAYNYYIVGSLCSYLYSSGDKITAVGTAVSYTGDYTKVNPIRVLINLCVQNGDNDCLLQIKQSLEGRENKNQLVINDIFYIEDFIKE